MARLPSPLKRVGGKANLHKWIIYHLLQLKHECFVEVCGGSAPVLLNKPRPKGKEVYNDKDGIWHNSMKMCREQGAELAEMIAATPYSRKEFDENRQKLKLWRAGQIHIAPLELARMHLIEVRQSFSADGGSWSTSSFIGENRPKLWAHLPDDIQRFMNRLRGVYIEQRDYRYILDRYDNPLTEFYIDPPYYGVEDLYYDVNRKDGFDHTALRNAVENLKGTVAISYYRSDHIVDLYKGWRIEEKPVTVHAGSTQRNETELLIIRPSPYVEHRPRKKLVDIFEDEE